MKKILLSLLLLASISSFPIASQAAASSVTQLVELLINIGAINPDKVAAARLMAATLDKPVQATSSLPYLQILSPNGGESWDMDLDLAYQINWGASSEIPVSVGLVNSRGIFCNLTPTPIISQHTENSFKILLKKANCYDSKTGSTTPLVSGSYKARVTYTGFENATTTIVKDDSDAVFTLVPIPDPSIKITYPNGGEKLVRNTTYDVKYTLKDTTDGKIIYGSLIDTNGNSSNYLQRFGKSGIFEFKVGSGVSEGAYKIHLKMTADNKEEIEDTSDSFFWVSPKS